MQQMFGKPHLAMIRFQTDMPLTIRTCIVVSQQMWLYSIFPNLKTEKVFLKKN